MFVGEKNIQNSNRGFNRAIVEADESVVGADVMNFTNIQNSNGGFNRAVVEADESIVGTDVQMILRKKLSFSCVYLTKLYLKFFLRIFSFSSPPQPESTRDLDSLPQMS
jgi:hypothetical protein